MKLRNTDSVVTFGCVEDVGYMPITQDIDMFHWLDGISLNERHTFPTYQTLHIERIWRTQNVIPCLTGPILFRMDYLTK